MAYDRVTPRHTTGQSKEFSAGSALAELQSQTGLSYEEITAKVPVSEMISMYDAYHSRSVSELPWQMDGEARYAAIEEIKASFPAELMKEFDRRRQDDPEVSKETHLKQMRLRNGLSQSQLAAASGVPVRTLQQYEQRRKDINKAQFEYILRLSSALNCDPTQLME